MTTTRPGATAGGTVEPRVVLAVLSMAAAAFLSSLMHAGVRLAGEELSAFQIAFIRTTVTCGVLLPLLLLPRHRSAWRSRRPGLEILRGVVGCGAVVLWFYALTVTPLAEAAALSFTMSIFVTAGAALFLGEPVGRRRWSAVLAGILGALIILRPGFTEFSWGSAAVILSSALWGTTLLMTKRLSPVDGNLTLVLYMAAVVSLILAVPVLTDWTHPSPRVAAIAIGLGLLSALIGLCIANGIRHADISVTQPIGFTRLIWAGLVGYLLFDERPGTHTLLGAAIILGASLYISYRESRLARERDLRPKRAHARAEPLG